MKNSKLGNNAQNDSFLHNVFFCPQLLDTTKWVIANDQTFSS
jgi:hypothetical protein